MGSTQELGAIVLLSGGLDSATTLAVARSKGNPTYALTIDYGQRNRFELQAAKTVAESFGATEHKTVKIDLRCFGGSSLTSHENVERNRPREQIGTNIPSTYVPARNTILLSYALAWAEVIPAQEIYIGVNAVDSSGYPDCRPEFIAAFENTANFATRLGTSGKRIKICTPLIALTKAEIIKLGLSLGLDYSLTMTCYDPDPSGTSCGTCDSCILRQQGFYEAGAKDPLRYATP